MTRRDVRQLSVRPERGPISRASLLLVLALLAEGGCAQPRRQACEEPRVCIVPSAWNRQPAVSIRRGRLPGAGLGLRRVGRLIVEPVDGETGRVVRGATVLLGTRRGGRVVARSAAGEADTVVALAPVGAGWYVIAVEAIGYCGQTADVAVRAGSQDTVALALPKACLLRR